MRTMVHRYTSRRPLYPYQKDSIGSISIKESTHPPLSSRPAVPLSTPGPRVPTPWQVRGPGLVGSAGAMYPPESSNMDYLWIYGLYMDYLCISMDIDGLYMDYIWIYVKFPN